MAGAEKQSGREQNGRDAGSIRQRLDSSWRADWRRPRAGSTRLPGPSRKARGPRSARRSGWRSNWWQAWRSGAFIGWGLDRCLGTAPFLMVVFLGLGAAAGIMNVMRTAKRMQADAQSVKDLPSVWTMTTIRDGLQ